MLQAALAFIIEAADIHAPIEVPRFAERQNIRRTSLLPE
jgi:hypothetical protein